MVLDLRDFIETEPSDPGVSLFLDDLGNLALVTRPHGITKF